MFASRHICKKKHVLFPEIKSKKIVFRCKTHEPTASYIRHVNLQRLTLLSSFPLFSSSKGILLILWDLIYAACRCFNLIHVIFWFYTDFHGIYLLYSKSVFLGVRRRTICVLCKMQDPVRLTPQTVIFP